MYLRQITNREAGQRLDRYLCKLLPMAGTGFLHKMLRKKNITLNGKKAEGHEKLTARLPYILHKRPCINSWDISP